MLADHYLLREYCEQVRRLSGDAAEIGVYRGESAATICESLPAVTVHLYDTFTGFPKELISKIDNRPVGQFSDTSVFDVKKRLSKFSNFAIHPGIFPATAVDVPLRFVHVDVDLESSTRSAIRWAWPLLVFGGIMLCDDYGNSECKGAKLAIDEFAADFSLNFVLRNGRAIFTKPEAI